MLRNLKLIKISTLIYPVDKHIFLLFQPEVVEKLVNLREGIPRKDAKEVHFTLNSRNIFKISTQFGLVSFMKADEMIDFVIDKMLLLLKRSSKSAKRYMRIHLLTEDLQRLVSFSDE